MKKYQKYILYIWGLFASMAHAETYILMDIDNTLFRNGEPIVEMIKKVQDLEKDKSIKIYFLTGRKENEHIKIQIKTWLKNQSLDSNHIHLKPKDEFDTAKFKHDFLIKHLKFKEDDYAIVVDDNKNNFKYFNEKNVEKIWVEKDKYKEAVDRINQVLNTQNRIKE